MKLANKINQNNLLKKAVINSKIKKLMIPNVPKDLLQNSDLEI